RRRDDGIRGLRGRGEGLEQLFRLGGHRGLREFHGLFLQSELELARAIAELSSCSHAVSSSSSESGACAATPGTKTATHNAAGTTAAVNQRLVSGAFG